MSATGTTIQPASAGLLQSLVPSSALNAVTGLNNGLQGLVSAIPQIPQYFFTVPFANNQTVLYKLQIVLDPNNPTAVLPPFIFPLTPSNVNKSVLNLTNYYDVKGDASNYGVQRIIDIYGLTPPIITISGSTGFQFHSLDNYQWSGKSSFALLVQMIQTYAQRVAVATAAGGTPMPTLQFTDGFTGEVFTVVPISKQAYSMDVSKPIIQTYNLQFLAQNTTTPVTATLDPIAQTFILGRALLTAGVLSFWVSLLNNISLGSIS